MQRRHGERCTAGAAALPCRPDRPGRASCHWSGCSPPQPKPAPHLQVVDYYTIVKKPICLKDIRGKLERNQYATPTEMYLVRPLLRLASNLILSCQPAPPPLR